jgi:diguanylate cyclase (GGDEF)-like protein
MIFRYGGEEFLLFLPGTDSNGAYVCAEKIRLYVENKTLINKNNLNIKITVSAGIASYPINGKNESELISNADKSLYNSKNSGRNKVSISKEIED